MLCLAGYFGGTSVNQSKKVNVSLTLLFHLIAETEIELVWYERPVHSILWQWIENCFKRCCREKLLSAERSSLLAGLVDTQ